MKQTQECLWRDLIYTIRIQRPRLWVSLHILTYLLHIYEDILSASCKICLGPTCVCYIISSPFLSAGKQQKYSAFSTGS